ncbi:MAG: Gp19/Gp15/Gp42 family protein [Propionibacteriaceae bacterium]|nr:Gp19/Gp15/Gp42 family protein [Propionibacteriaceae bacterium]
MLVELDDLTSRLPRALEGAEAERAAVLLGDAEDMVADALAREGRDLDVEVAARPAFARTVARIVREMVGAAIMAGQFPGARSVSSTTGPTSDSVTWAVSPMSGWASLTLTDEMLADLGLGRGGPRGRFPAPPRWPEVILHGRDDHGRWA